MHQQVEIRALAFQTAALRVALGDTVTWTNQEIVPHTVTSDGPDASLQSPMLARDSTFTWVAKAIGTVRYHCQYHPSMIATVEVVP